MPIPLYNTDIIPLTSRPTLTVIDDGDYFVILDTSTGKISKILRTNIQKALNISYDNTTSGLTAETVQAALDELVVNLGSTDSAIATLQTTVADMQGTGYTEGTLKSHEDRLDTTQLAVARHDQSINALEKTVQGGQGATVDYTGTGIVTTDARSIGRANVTADGSMVGADSVTIPARLKRVGRNLFDISKAKDNTTLVNGLEAINTSRKASDFIKIAPSSQFIFSGLTITAIFQYDENKLNPTTVSSVGGAYTTSPTTSYIRFAFDKTVTFAYGQLNLGSSALPYEPYDSQALVIQDTAELRSVPAIADQVLVQDGEWWRKGNVSEPYTLLDGDISSVTELTNVTVALISKSTFTNSYVMKAFGDFSPDRGKTIRIEGGYSPLGAGVADAIVSIGMYYVNPGNWAVIFAKGTTLAQAKTALAGKKIWYQVTPTLTKLHTIGSLSATPSCTISWGGWTEDSYQTDASSQITLTHTGAIEKVFGYDDHFVEYEVPSTGYTQVGTLLTITGAEENEVWYVQQVKDTALYPQMTVNTLNNEKVTLDTANGKYYQIGHTTTNGVPTVTATEVV